MDSLDNIHNGHRERMMTKLQNNPSSLLDYELLEILLYFSIPRKDVNELSHILIRTFGSLKNIFSATAEELMSVKGVGKKTAVSILAISSIYKRIYNTKKQEKRQILSFDVVKDIVITSFLGVYKEQFNVYFFDKDYVLLSTLNFDNNSRSNVSVDIGEVAHSIAILKPTSVLIAHNHPSGNVEPSKSDDVSTAKIYLLCSSHGVSLLDHIIVFGSKTYSYYSEGRLDHIKKSCLIENLLQNE